MTPVWHSLLFPLVLPFNTLFIQPSCCSIGDENWITAVRKGAILYEQLQSGCFPERANSVTVAELLAGGWEIRPPWPPPRSPLAGFTPFVADTFGWTHGKDYFYEEVFRKKERVETLTTEFLNIYSPRNGFIGASQTFKSPLEPIYWSDVTFALWKGLTSVVGGDVKNLRYIGRGLIGNDFTVSIMDSAVPPGSPEKVTVLKSGNEAFVALLGTPNGVGGVYLLMQHKQALGFKTISRIFLIRDRSGYDPFLIFEVVSMRPPWGCRGAALNASGISVDAGAALDQS